MARRSETQLMFGLFSIRMKLYGAVNGGPQVIMDTQRKGAAGSLRMRSWQDGCCSSSCRQTCCRIPERVNIHRLDTPALQTQHLSQVVTQRSQSSNPGRGGGRL